MEVGEEEGSSPWRYTRRGLGFKKHEDFGQWYADVVVKGELIDYYQVSGCYILRPWSYAIWETIKSFLDTEIKAMGVDNAYFPLFVHEKSLNKEKEHVAGFAPEVAWVTKAGSSDLDVPVAIRPTSETVMYPSFAKWIRGHRDLPLKLNQWCNVVRWEFKDPTPFIRSREFLWQEGHTAFATKEEADAEVQVVLELYRKVYEELLAVPVIKGVKSEREKFAGAVSTTTLEAFVVQGCGRGIQAATVHSLGQKFSESFKIVFEDENGASKRVWQNSWGLSTRAIGAMVMVHGDDKGLLLPPRVAPIQVIIIPIPITSARTAAVATSSRSSEAAAAAASSSSSRMTAASAAVADSLQECKAVARLLQEGGIRSATDLRENYTPGWKYAHWEMKGVPLRIEIGLHDIEKMQVTVARRDLEKGAEGHKSVVPKHQLLESIRELLNVVQRSMLEKAQQQRDAAIAVALNWQDFETAVWSKKMVLAPWCDEVEAEKEVQEKLKGCKTLCMPFKLQNSLHSSLASLVLTSLASDTKCFVTGKPAKSWGLWGRSF
jgi:prolyl-tRNA synthetase